MAVKATCEVITSLLDEDAIHVFSPLFPQLIQHLVRSTEEGSIDISNIILDFFENITAAEDPSFYLPHLTDILHVCCTVGFLLNSFKILLKFI